MSPARRGAAAAVPEEAVDLDLDQVETSDQPSFTFRLDGQRFRCRSQGDLSWDTIEKWLNAQATGNLIVVVTENFFEQILFPEDVEAFNELKSQPKSPLTSDRAIELINTINEKVFGIKGAADPTKRPASSQRGSRKSGSGSKAKHDGRVTRTA